MPLSAEDLRRVLAASLVVARAAASGQVEELAEQALEQVFDLVPCDRAAFFSVDPLTDEAVRLAWRERQPPGPARFAPGQGAIGWVIAHRAPLLLNDARRDPRYQPMRYPSTRSFLAVPLVWEERVSGALACASFAADAFTPAHVELLRLFAEHLAAAFALASGGPASGSAAVPHVLAEYAHEVRGHLHTALGYLSLAARDAGPRAPQLLEEARRACQRAVDLADSTLESAAEERRSLGSLPHAHATDLALVAGGCAERARSSAALREARIETHLDSRPALVAARQQALERLLDNLLLNAIQHSPAGGTVALRLETQGDRAVVTVEDEGPGIPERDLEKIFTPFYRANGGRRDRAGGLGLSLARRWAAQAGGRLWAENRAGGGARFVLQIPLLGGSATLGTGSLEQELEDE